MIRFSGTIVGVENTSRWEGSQWRSLKVRLLMLIIIVIFMAFWLIIELKSNVLPPFALIFLGPLG